MERIDLKYVEIIQDRSLDQEIHLIKHLMSKSKYKCTDQFVQIYRDLYAESTKLIQNGEIKFRYRRRGNVPIVFHVDLEHPDNNFRTRILNAELTDNSIREFAYKLPNDKSIAHLSELTVNQIPTLRVH